MPNTPTTGAIVPVVLVNSGDQTHRMADNLLLKPEVFLSCWRRARASGQPSTLLNRVSRICAVSTFRPAPMDAKTVADDADARVNSKALSATLSMASIT